jgi:hypothetical protein
MDGWLRDIDEQVSDSLFVLLVKQMFLRQDSWCEYLEFKNDLR